MCQPAGGLTSRGLGAGSRAQRLERTGSPSLTRGRHSRGDLGGGRRLSGVKTGVREDEVMMMVTMGIVATILVSLAAVTATPGTGSGAK